MSSILITGSNRGMGLQWARQYAEAGWRVFATCRHPREASELKKVAKEYAGVSLHPLDVTDAVQIEALATELAETPIDILLNNAGVYYEKHMSVDCPLDYDDWIHTFQVNTMGPVRVTMAFANHVAASLKRLVVAISSHMGSIAEIDGSGSYFYRSSKAALNAVMKGLSFELARRGIGVLLLHPGWVRTRMGGPDAPLLPEESVRGLRLLIDNFSLPDSGRFFRFDGSEIPW
ncbi:MAG: SDR family oxidoreductase [Pseudomonadota bacterium]